MTTNMSKLMNRPPPNTGQMPPPQPQSVSSMNNQTFVEKIIVGMDHAPQQFDLRGQLIGAGGANLHYIRNETGAIATLRGRGSMFIDLALGTESPEPLHLYIEHPRYDGLQSAKQLAKNLIETLQQELVLYHQLHPPTTSNGSVFTATPAPHSGLPPALTTPQMSVPPPMVAVPPPAIHAPEDQFLSQASNSILPNAQIPPPNHVNILQHQSPIPQAMPVHLHPANVILQQQISPVPTLSNVSVPPPNIHMKHAPMMHLQGPPPNQIQLTQPPPNIQLQPTQPPNTQILLNQTQPTYQYQYIQQAPDGSSLNPNQITVQHIYQHQPPIQGLIQHQPPTQQFNSFSHPGQIQRHVQPIQAAAPQYFLQGNNAYLVPPPNMIQNQPTGNQTQQNIIFQTQPPPHHIQMQQIQSIQTSIQHQPQPQSGIEMTNNGDELHSIKEEASGSPIRENSPSKDSPNSDSKVVDPAANGDSKNGSEHDEPTVVQQHVQQISLETSAQLMNVPPPITCVQHIVGNTLITTAANQSQPHKIFNQIPVSLQQIQAQQPQQIHVSTANGQHFLVQAQHWAQPATQFQPVSQAGNIQGFHLAPAQQITNDMQPTGQQQQVLANAFNQLQAPPGMQVQFQQIHSAQPQHVIQQLPVGSVAHLIEQPPPSIQASQMHIHSMPPTFSVSSMPPPTPMHETMASQPRLGSPYQQNLQHTAVYSMSKTNIVDTQLRIGQKRKLDEDALAAQKQHASSRSGIGTHASAASITTTTQIATTTSSTASHTSSSNVQDEPNSAADSYLSGDGHNSNYDSIASSNKQLSLMHPMTGGAHRTNNQTECSTSGFGPDAGNAAAGMPSQRYPFDVTGPPRGPPRYRHTSNRGDFAYPMRPPPPPMHMQDANFPMHRMNYRPPPPPPPPYGPPPSHFAQWYAREELLKEDTENFASNHENVGNALTLHRSSLKDAVVNKEDSKKCPSQSVAAICVERLTQKEKGKSLYNDLRNIGNLSQKHLISSIEIDASIGKVKRTVRRIKDLDDPISGTLSLELLYNINSNTNISDHSAVHSYIKCTSEPRDQSDGSISQMVFQNDQIVKPLSKNILQQSLSIPSKLQKNPRYLDGFRPKPFSMSSPNLTRRISGNTRLYGHKNKHTSVSTEMKALLSAPRNSRLRDFYEKERKPLIVPVLNIPGNFI